MTPEPTIPPLEPYVFELLIVASEATYFGSKRPAMLLNDAVKIGIDWMGKMPAAAKSRKNGKDLPTRWIGHLPDPASAFELSGTLVEAMDQIVRNRHPKISLSHPSEPTKFDQHVYLAIGQTVAEFVGFKNGVGPSAEQTWARLSAESPRNLQRVFFRNYLGNVLQDYFDACKVRAAHPKLPRSEEEALRMEDAEDLADSIFDLIDREQNPIDAEVFLDKFALLLKLVWKHQRKKDNAQN